MFRIKGKLALISALVVAGAVSCFAVGHVATDYIPAPAQIQVEEPVNIYGGLTVLTQDVVPVEGDKAEIIVSSQDTGVVGELIRFDVSSSIAESFKWILVPESVDFEVYDNGKRAVFSARKPGEYMFVVACAFKSTVDVTTHVVTIEGVVPDDPDDPGDPDWPTVVDPGDDAPLQARVSYWCSQAKRPPAEALALADSFESVAAMTVAGVYTTPEEIIQATSAANREALGTKLQQWVPVMRQLQDEFQQMAQDGELVTPEQHAETWREVAAHLQFYASLFNIEQF